MYDSISAGNKNISPPEPINKDNGVPTEIRIAGNKDANNEALAHTLVLFSNSSECSIKK